MVIAAVGASIQKRFGYEKSALMEKLGQIVSFSCSGPSYDEFDRYHRQCSSNTYCNTTNTNNACELRIRYGEIHHEINFRKMRLIGGRVDWRYAPPSACAQCEVGLVAKDSTYYLLSMSENPCYFGF